MTHIERFGDVTRRWLQTQRATAMGDLAGGQMIAKRVPGKGKYYHFQDPEALKLAIRERLSDDMADEAKVCFDFAKRFFQDMMNVVKLYENV